MLNQPRLAGFAWPLKTLKTQQMPGIHRYRSRIGGSRHTCSPLSHCDGLQCTHEPKCFPDLPSPAAAGAGGAATPSKAQLKEENKRLREENKRLEQQLRKRPREQPASQSQISSYFLPRSNQGSFPWDPLVGSPTVKAKSSPSAIMGAGFIPDY